VHTRARVHARAHVVTFHTHAHVHASPSLSTHVRACMMRVIYKCMCVCTSYMHLPPVLPSLHHPNWNPPFRNTQVYLLFPIFLSLPPRLYGFVLGQHHRQKISCPIHVNSSRTHTCKWIHLHVHLNPYARRFIYPPCAPNIGTAPFMYSKVIFYDRPMVFSTPTPAPVIFKIIPGSAKMLPCGLRPLGGRRTTPFLAQTTSTVVRGCACCLLCARGGH
jgi:hypothetical protein